MPVQDLARLDLYFMDESIQRRLERHVAALLACDRCPLMHKPVVSGGAVAGRVMLVGQAPGVKEPQLGRPFAWTAGKTMFNWFQTHCNIGEAEFRASIYMAAVCRCFPGKNAAGGDRVPDVFEIAACSHWLDAEIAILKPSLVIPVGKLAMDVFGDLEKQILHLLMLPETRHWWPHIRRRAGRSSPSSTSLDMAFIGVRTPVGHPLHGPVDCSGGRAVLDRDLGLPEEPGRLGQIGRDLDCGRLRGS